MEIHSNKRFNIERLLKSLLKGTQRYVKIPSFAKFANLVLDIGNAWKKAKPAQLLQYLGREFSLRAGIVE